MALRIQVAGVGGHGVILVARVLTRLALDEGRYTVMSEVHGMSQRGGVVQSSVVIDGGDSPVIGKGEADCLIATEVTEALRHASLLKEGGAVVLNLWEEIPPHLAKSPEDYPPIEEGIKWFISQGFNVWTVDGYGIAREIGTPKVMNAAVLGALARAEIPGISFDGIQKALLEITGGRFKKENLGALKRGYEEAILRS